MLCVPPKSAIRVPPPSSPSTMRFYSAPKKPPIDRLPLRLHFSSSVHSQAPRPPHHLACAVVPPFFIRITCAQFTTTKRPLLVHRKYIALTGTPTSVVTRGCFTYTTHATRRTKVVRASLCRNARKRHHKTQRIKT